MMNTKKNHKTLFAALLLLLAWGKNVHSQDVEVVLQLGHNASVSAVAYSLDGKYVLSGSEDNTMKLWEVSTGREIRIFEGHSSRVRSVAFSQDGRFALSGSNDHTMKLWEVSSGREIHTFSGHSDAVSSVAFSPDDRYALSGSNDHTMKLWSVSKGRTIRTFRGHSGWVTSVAFSPDGKYMLSGSLDNTMKLWRVSRARAIRTFKGHSEPIWAVAYSPDGKYALSGGADDTMKLWEVSTGREIRTYKGHAYWVTSVAFSPDGLYAFSGSNDNTIKLWEVFRGREIRTFRGHSQPVFSVTISPNGQYVLSGSDDKTIKLWEVQSGREISSFEVDSDKIRVIAGVWSVSILPDGRYALSGSADKTMKLWDLSTGREIRTFRGHSHPVYSVVYSPDGLYALSGSIDKTMKLWEISSGREIHTFEGHSERINTVSISPDGKHALSGSSDKTMKLWDLSTGREIRTFEDHSSQVQSVSISPDGKHALSGSWDGTMKLWEVSTGREVRNFEGHTGTVFSVAFSPDGRFALSGSRDMTMKLWEVSTGREIRTFKGHSRVVGTVAYSQDGRYALSGSWDRTMKLWDVSTGREIRTFKGHSNNVWAVAFSPDGRYVLSGSYDGTIRTWDINSGNELVQSVSMGKDWLVITPDGYYYGSKGSFDGLHYVKGMRTYTFHQFDLQYNRPDIVLERIAKASPELIAAYRSAWEKRLRRMRFDPANFEQQHSFNVPEIELLTEIPSFLETRKRDFSFRIAAKDERFPLERVFVEVNGVPFYGVRGRDLSAANSKTTEQEISLPLSQGKNIIRVSVLNRSGVESLAERLEVTYRPPKSIKPNLHLITIGVSKFKDSDFNLTYAKKDADDLAILYRTASGRYGRINVYPFANEQATRSKILKLRSELEKTKVDDQVIIFIASHGVLDDELDYYLAMHDMDFANPQNGGLRYDELEALIDGIPARNKLVLIDACHSGEVDREETELVASNGPQTSDGVSSRGFKVVKTKESGIGLANSFELMKELFADLRRNNGAVVISAAAGQEFAFESSEWSNGVFTYSLLEGLKSGRADMNKDKTVSVSELRDYVSKRVQELTNGKQNPTSRTENLENDFRVW